jgi:hypothetical protein
MTPDERDWWARLVHDDLRPVHELRAVHLAKLLIAVARHLVTKHAQRFDRQVPLPAVTALHNDLHGATTGKLLDLHASPTRGSGRQYGGSTGPGAA